MQIGALRPLFAQSLDCDATRCGEQFFTTTFLESSVAAHMLDLPQLAGKKVNYENFKPLKK
jgi:cytochrome c biogenesis factor